MEISKKLVVAAFGETDYGRSWCGNAFLQKNDAFNTNDYANLNSFNFFLQINLIDEILAYFINIPSLSASDEQNNLKITRMIDFFNKWPNGISSIFIIQDITNPNLEKNTQKMIQLFNAFFNNTNIWNQFGIIFINCTKDNFNHEIAGEKYKSAVFNYLKSLPGCENKNLKIKYFFVDSTECETNKKTQQVFHQIFNFALSFSPIPTLNLTIDSINRRFVKVITINNIINHIERTNNGDSEIIKYFYDDIKRKIIVGLNGEELYRTSEVINSHSENEIKDIRPKCPPPRPPPEIIRCDSDSDGCFIM